MSYQGDERIKDLNEIQEIKKDVKTILKIINGNGKLGMAGKVDIIWGYRVLVAGIVVANVFTIIFYIVKGIGG